MTSALTRLPGNVQTVTALLKSAQKQGVLALAIEALRIARHYLWSGRHLIFALDTYDVETPYFRSELCFRWITSPDDVPANVRRRQFNWGHPSWFAEGWTLQIGEINGTPATFCWVRTASQCLEKFPEAMMELPNCEMIWHTTTLPEFRGRGLFVQALSAVIRSRMKAGVTGFLISCDDHNRTSVNAFHRLRFRFMGHYRLNYLTKKRAWKPAIPLCWRT